jgi:D-xylonolactonase
MNLEPELVADYACLTGEGPLWHAQEQRVYWVDIPRCRLFCYDPASGHHEQVYQGPEGDAIGGFTVQEDGALLLFMARGAVRRWRDGQLTTVIDEIPAERGTRFNDVIADPAGRVFGGTMGTAERPGKQYRLDTDGSLHVVMNEVRTPNGMGFTPDRKRMYFTDTPTRCIFLYDYDEASGAISNRRVFAQSPDAPDEGRPDGMTVDAEGCVWSARWGGSCLVRYAPDGTEIGRLTFPAKKVSSAVFGGPDLADLYVTTAGGDNKAEEGHGAGALFRVRPGVRGVPEFVSRIRRTTSSWLARQRRLSVRREPSRRRSRCWAGEPASDSPARS